VRAAPPHIFYGWPIAIKLGSSTTAFITIFGGRSESGGGEAHGRGLADAVKSSAVEGLPATLFSAARTPSNTDTIWMMIY